jgi:hypothetical protein
MFMSKGILLVSATLCISANAIAAPDLLSNDPRRPVESVSRDLGIKPEQFVACFENVNPAPQGERPTTERVHANKAVLLGCLQKADAGITNEKLDEVMDRYRPGGHEAQAPAK